MRYCYHCGKQISPNVRYCRYCGADQEKCCPGCGRQWKDGEQFCPVCGKQRELETAGASENQAFTGFQTMPETSEKKEKTDKILELVKGTLYFALCVLCSIQLGCAILKNVSILSITGNIFPIMICVAFWLIYSDGKKESLNSSGFSILGVIMWIKTGVFAVIGFAVLCASGRLSAGITITGLIAAVLFAGFYWYLGRILFGIRKYGRGVSTSVQVGIYPLVVMGIELLWKIVSLVAMRIIAKTVSTVLWAVGGELAMTLYRGQDWLVQLLAVAILVIEFYFLMKLHVYGQENS